MTCIFYDFLFGHLSRWWPNKKSYKMFFSKWTSESRWQIYIIIFPIRRIIIILIIINYIRNFHLEYYQDFDLHQTGLTETFKIAGDLMASENSKINFAAYFRHYNHTLNSKQGKRHLTHAALEITLLVLVLNRLDPPKHSFSSFSILFSFFMLHYYYHFSQYNLHFVP